MQLFYGMSSGHTSGYPMRLEKQVGEVYEDHIRKVGAPVGILSDRARSEVHGKAKDIMRMYEIDDGQSEPGYQHQNPAECQIQNIKCNMNNGMDGTGCPSCWWLLAATFVILLMNHLPNSEGDIPITKITGQIPDVSKFMHFHFWQEVFVESHKDGQRKELARWVYPAENIGDELTYMVLLSDTNQLVPRSNVRPALDPLYPNLRVRPQTEDLRTNCTDPRVYTPGGIDATPMSTVEHDDEFVGPTETSGERNAPSQGPITNVQDLYDVPIKLPKFSPEELLGLTFLHDVDDGQQVRAKIVKKILDRDAENHERIKMLITYNDDKIEEIVAYNKLCDIVAEQHEKELNGEADLITFVDILEHEGPLRPTDSNYKGSSYNVKMLWNDASKTWEPLSMIMATDPVTLAVYAKEHGLLETPGWKKLKKYARHAKKLMRMVNQNKRAQRFNTVTYKFGVRLPRNVPEAYRLNKKNGNTYWADAIKLEIKQLMEYKTFRDMGRTTRIPPGYQQIPLRMFADTLRTLGFTPTYADPDVWIRDGGDCYEYIVVYVDNIFTALKEPVIFYDAIQSKPWNYKLKNVKEPKYHLGGDFFRDSDGTFCYGAQTYVKRMSENYEQLFGEPPKEYHSPMERGDQPELDVTMELRTDDIMKFQSMIGAVQWTVSLSRFDVAHAVMSLGRFRAKPRQGHLERLCRLIGYMKKRRGGAIRFRTGIPDWENAFPEPIKYDWMETVYGTPPEEVDSKAPTPKGRMFLNQTPIDWFSKRQNQVETATYGSEFMAARQATEQIIDLRYTLRSFGVPLDGPAWLFGDNKSVVTSSTIPHSTLGKRFREAIAGGWLRFKHIPGAENPADVLTKSLAWNVLKTYIEPLLFWKGETSDAPSGSPNPEGSITSPGHETPLASGVSTNVSVDVDTRQHDSEADVDARQHDPGQDQDQPTFNRLWNNQYAVLMELDM
eukprot:scaffold2692_cov115-Amphora_coffeaeformis.AAC.2